MKILLVDDERKMGVILKGALEEEGHAVLTLEKSNDALARMKNEAYDLLITDLRMAPPDGLELLRQGRALQPDMAVILMTAYATAQTAVEAMKSGAYDYLIKPFELDEIRLRVKKLGQERDLRENVRLLRRENEVLRREVGSPARLGSLLGKSAIMRDVLDLAEKVAATDATVLLRGESGTGKSLLARGIHDASARCDCPFVIVNCGALPESLLESELFGHEKGAFTGAVATKRGRFVGAEGGTILLDEIGDMSAALQVKLLHVLEDKEFYAVGSDKPTLVNVRVIAATNRNLEEAMGEGQFREDLFYRLNVFPIPVPPLRSRREDLPMLLEHFLSRFGHTFADLTSRARESLFAYSFPGNVRELENMVERAAILAGPGAIDRQHFPALREQTQVAAPSDRPPVLRIPEEGLSLVALEKELIQQALEVAGGNKSQAARLLGLTRRTLYSRLERHGLAPGGDKTEDDDEA
jgi:DNA-binding NtrC family response regulator